MSNRTKGNIALLITAVIWGSGFIAQKLGMAYIGPLAFNSVRQLIAGVVLIPYSMLEMRRTEIFSRVKFSNEVIRERKRDIFRGAGICGILLALGSNAQQVGLVDSSAGKVGFITAIYIVLVPIIGIILGQRSTLKTWVCVVLAMVGFGFLSLRGGFTNITRGDWITLLGAVFFACQIAAVNVFVTRSNAILFSNVQMLVSGLIGLAGMFLFENTTAAALLSSWKPILYSALIPTAIGFTLQIVGQRYTDPTAASLIMSLEAVFAALLGVLLLNEHMEAREWLGCMIIFIATVIAQIPGKAPSEPVEELEEDD